MWQLSRDRECWQKEVSAPIVQVVRREVPKTDGMIGEGQTGLSTLFTSYGVEVLVTGSLRVMHDEGHRRV